MSRLDLVLIAFGLSMDAFAVAVCVGLSPQENKGAVAVEAALLFGGFQMLMPLGGYLLGSRFESLIHSVDHWIAFILLFILGLQLLGSARESSRGCASAFDGGLSHGRLLVCALATSVDALAAGITFAVIQVNILPAAALIGLITLALSFLAVMLGSLLGERVKTGAEILGGVILILMGFKILIEHLFFS